MGRIRDVIRAEAQRIEAEGLLESGKGLTRTSMGEYVAAVKVQVPRNKAIVQKRVLDECQIAGEEFYYSWTIHYEDKETGEKKTKIVEGPSIKLAMCLAREWTNCAIDVFVSEDESHWTFTGVFVDLETGFTAKRLYRQRKSSVTGQYEPDRKLDIAFQIGQSKCIRNVVISSMPGWLVERALKAAKQSTVAEIKTDVARAISVAIESFGAFGVSQEMLEQKLNKPVAEWTADDVALLRGLYRALADGETSIRQEFGLVRPPMRVQSLTIKDVQPGEPKPQATKRSLTKARKGESQHTKAGKGRRGVDLLIELGAAFNRLDLTPEQQCRLASNALGRKVASISEITPDDARKLLANFDLVELRELELTPDLHFVEKK